jgi:hypothetical protein
MLWKSHTLPLLDNDEGRARKFGMISLLQHFDHLGCADDRDHIFALLGMAENINDSQPRENFNQDNNMAIDFRADYSKNNEVVYIDFAEAMANAGLLEMILTEATARPCLDGLLQSWVPDWRTPPDSGHVLDGINELEKTHKSPITMLGVLHVAGSPH